MIVSTVGVIDRVYTTIPCDAFDRMKLSEFFLGINMDFSILRGKKGGMVVQFSRLITCFFECDENKRQFRHLERVARG